jgi:DNA-binding beta-propeller fold protein YncE
MLSRYVIQLLTCCAALSAGACHGASAGHTDRPADAAVEAKGAARLPLVNVGDIPLPGGATRFDYQDVDSTLGRLVITHMNDGSVLFLDLKDGSVLKELTGIAVARGVAVAPDVGLSFVTSSPNALVIIDNASMTEKSRVTTGAGPDGVGWDPKDKVVGVSDQGDGAISLIPESGSGTRKQVKLGSETGNVVFDQSRGWFWITVVATSPPDRLFAVDPNAVQVKSSIPLEGCNGAHGLRLHPDGRTAFVACESNATLLRVDLDATRVVGSAATGSGPDVMSVDAGLGWLYVAAESGDLTVFDIGKDGVTLIGHDQPGSSAHSVAVDPTTHRAFFPLAEGPGGKPVLRIMRPSGI